MRVFNANDGAATVPGIAAGEHSTLAVDGKVTLTGGPTVNVGADGYAAAGLSATGAPVGAVALAILLLTAAGALLRHRETSGPSGGESAE
ncbi:amylopullulanase [Bifidobacterium bifidum]|uniref:amylopullulanase n=1 Tax=Bifidobacterium bifidum TaxID=1681 RepID=UPI0021C8CFA5|nr:amylopullulanase [Bifidobacterium bifidum]